MPLITCPECGKQISDKSEFCVGCGCPASAFTKKAPEAPFADLLIGDVSVDETSANQTPVIDPSVEVIIKDGILVKVCDPKNKLVSFAVPEGIWGIESKAFIEAEKLRELTIPEGVRAIGGLVFAYTKIQELDLPKSLEEVGAHAFAHMSRLKKLRFQSMPKEMGPYLFQLDEDEGKTSLTVELPDGITTIPYAMFNDAYSLSQIIIPKSVKKIERHAFWGCKRLKSIKLHEGLEEIGNFAFWGCESLTSVTVPKSVKKIEWGAFDNCASLEKVTMKSPEGWSCTLVDNYPSLDEEPEFGERIDLSVGECPSPETVAQYLTRDFLEYVFEKGLAPVITEELPDVIAETADLDDYDETKFLIQDKVLLKYLGDGVDVRIPKGVVRIESFAFLGCKITGNVYLPNTLVSIGDHAFYGTDISYVFGISEGLLTIGEYAFEKCRKLCTMDIPASVRMIGKGAFFECDSLRSVHFKKISGWIAAIDKEAKNQSDIEPSRLARAGSDFSSIRTTLSIGYLIRK